jgi:methionine synthase reductase
VCSLEETVDPWIKNLWPALAHQVISAPKIHDLPQPHLNAEEEKVVKELIRKHDHEPHVAPAVSASPKKVSATDSMVKGGSTSSATTVPTLGSTSIASLTQSLSSVTVKEANIPAVPATGYRIEVDFSTMANHSNLTALPRVPNANLRIAKVVTENTAAPQSSRAGSIPSFIQTPTRLLSAKISRVQCLTPEDALKRTLSVEFGFDDDVDYAPGDAFGIWAPNDEATVLGVLAALDIKEEEYQGLVKLEGEGIPSHLQSVQSATLMDILRYAVDLTSAPKKANIRLYGDHATDLVEKQKLLYMASKQGVEVFNAFRAQSPTFLDILKTFPSIKLPLSRVIETLPPMQPRYYSITSSPMAKNGHRRWACAFNVVEYDLPEGVKRRGVCTPWLDDLAGKVPFGSSVIAPTATRVAMFLKPNETKFNLPSDTLKPVIMIGPGTGVAPFMGFLEHRSEQRRIKKRLVNIGAGPRQHLDDHFGDMWLFFGCRHRERDWLFRKEMETYKEEGVLTELHLAVSREENVPNSGKYVQDLIKKEGARIWKLLDKKQALIYVCG